MKNFNSFFGKILSILFFCLFVFNSWDLVKASNLEATVYDDVLKSVYNIILTIIVVTMCIAILTYIYIKNSNKKIKELIGEELYTKLYKFRKIENLFNKAINGAGSGIVVLLKINNIDFLKELYGNSSVENYVAKIGEKLKAELPGGFVFGRIAISDFLIYSTDEKDELILNSDILNIYNSMKEAVNLNEMRINSNFNMGVSKMSGASDIRRELLRRATLAMWYSKRQGPNRFGFYTSEIDEKFIKEEEILKELNRALAKEEFELYYQPIINSDDDSIYGFEALIRWNHPEKGVLRPNYFLQEAEKNDMIIEIGYWVIDQAFRDYNSILNRFNSERINNLRLSINISPNQFKDKYLVENLKNYLVKYNMNPENVVLEITEQVYIQETLIVNDLLRSIKNLGCKIAFDDFGIEYSTLSKLQDLNFDVVKIDRQFILGIPEDRVSIEIIKMLVSLTNITQKKLIAEGVDSEEQLVGLRRYGCNTIQGFYFSKALSIDNLLGELYQRNIKNENFGHQKMSPETEKISQSPGFNESILKLVQFEQLFKNLNSPASINRLIEDKTTGGDNIILTEVNDLFKEKFYVQGESLIGRKKAAVYPSINQIQMNEISQCIRNGKDVRFPYFYHERSNTSYDLSVLFLAENKFAMIFFETSDNSITLNKLKTANSNLEEVKYMLDISLSVGKIDVWEFNIENHKIKMIWHDICSERTNYMNEYSLVEYLDWIHPTEQGRFRREFMNCILGAKGRKYDPKAQIDFDYRIKPPHRDEWNWVSTKVHIIEYDGDQPRTAAAINIDIEQRKNYEETIKYQLIHDNLTGLLNREGLKIELERLLTGQDLCAVAFLDMDDFKLVNDKGGHEAGNRTLIEISNKISTIIPEGAVTARLSGDEFLVAFKFQTFKELKMTSDKLLKKIKTPMEDGMKVTASMGIAIYPEHSVNISELMTYADKAMYKSKELGKNCYFIHTME